MTRSERNVVIVGAGPYGLAAAMHLRRAGVEASVFGDPMSFWRGMPIGMVLRSNWGASNIAELNGELSLDAYKEATGESFERPIPLDCFVDYGTWFQQRVVPDVDPRSVTLVTTNASGFRLELDDGETVHARRVVIAAGIASFASRPAFGELPSELASHTGDHRDLGRFAGKKVLVVGGGQSALESAALLQESGASAEVFVRADHINWLSGGWPQRRLGKLAPLFYAPTDVGPGGLSRLVAVPDLFRHLPRAIQTPIAARSIRAAGARWLLQRLEGVPIHAGREIVSAQPSNGAVAVELSDGARAEADHLLFGTGYRVDLAKYGFLAPSLLERVRQVAGHPILSSGLESSQPGLHFLGAPAAWSFGPIMRFVSGTWFSGAALKRFVVSEQSRRNGFIPRSNN